MSTLMDTCNGFGRLLLENGQAPDCAWIGHVNQVMRYTPAFLQRRFGSPDIHATVKETRICRDDLTPKSFGKANGNLGLANCSRTNDDNQGRLSLFSRNGCPKGERGLGRAAIQ